MAFKAQNIHSQIFGEQPQMQPDSRRGRSKRLHDRRNEAFIDRYYFEGRSNPSKQSDKLVEDVAEQFFLSTFRAYMLINEHLDRLLELKKLNPSVSFFQKKWPQYKW